MSATPQLILILSGLTAVVMGILLLMLAKRNTHRVDGLLEWTYGLLTLSASFPLFLLREMIPDLFSIVAANILVLTGFMLINKGLRKFFAFTHAFPKSILIFFLGGYVCSFIWFTYVDNDIYLRALLFTTGSLLVLLNGLWILLRNFQRSPGLIILLLAIALLVTGRVIRLTILLFSADQPQELFGDSFYQLLALAIPYFAIPIATIAFIVLAYERLTLRLNELLRQDELTASLNKRSFYEEAQREIKRAIRYKHPTSFLMIDIDNFKSINDQLGHIQGDKILRQIADQIRLSLRTTDLVSRFGGDEFVVILPETKITIAQKIAERIVATTAREATGAYTVSIGLAALVNETDTVETVLNRADLALYKAKKAGKNRCAMA